MAIDQLPTVFGDAGGQEVVPVMQFGADGFPAKGNSGQSDPDNSTSTPLDANGTFTGPWVTNSDPHIGFNLKADQAGTFYIEFSPDGGDTITLSKPYDIRANEARFDVLVKFPSRSHRVRYVNGPVAQADFVLLTVTGDGLYPFVQSDRDDPRFVPLVFSAITATRYFGLVDLSDRTNFPHSETGRIDLHATYFQVDRNSSATGSLRLGVITRVSATSADIAYVQGVTFTNSDTRRITRDRNFRNPIQLGQSGGNLTRAIGVKELNVAAVNTATLITGPAGLAWTPAVGDLVARAERTAGEYSGSLSVQYSAKVSTT